MENRKDANNNQPEHEAQKIRTIHSFRARIDHGSATNDDVKPMGWKQKLPRSKKKRPTPKDGKQKLKEHRQPESEAQTRKEQPIHFEWKSNMKDCRTMVGK